VAYYRVRIEVWCDWDPAASDLKEIVENINRRLPLEPRPPDPPYSDLIKLYRDGNKQPLEIYIGSMLVP
jgi:hypothetical protein